MYARWLYTLLAVVTLPGCAALNTFQTADVLSPGEFELRPGVTIGSSGRVLNHYNDDRARIPLGRGVDLGARVGILPRVDVGAHVVGLAAVGADVKVQLVSGALSVAANAGAGMGKAGESGFGGSTTTESRARYGGLFVGYKDLYAAFKLTDYFYRKEEYQDVGGFLGRYEYDRLIPGLALGALGDREDDLQPILEMNAYFLPHPVLTLSMGIRIRSGGSR